jgi:hypothetical protein
MGLLTVGTDTYINLDTGINLDVVDYILYIYTIYIYTYYYWPNNGLVDGFINLYHGYAWG